MSAELLPCPFCRDTRIEIRWVDYRFRGVCVSCEAMAGGGREEEDAVVVWNRRAQQPNNECQCPQRGSWIAADDVNALVRRLDVAINGEDAAEQASLCDIVAQVEKAFRDAAQQPSAQEAVSFAVELADGSISLLGWMDMSKFDLKMLEAIVPDGSRYVFAYREVPTLRPVSDEDVLPADATDEMVDSVRYLLIGIEQPGRTYGSVRRHCELSGMDTSHWPEWTKGCDNEHFAKAACAALIWHCMRYAAIESFLARRMGGGE